RGDGAGAFAQWNPHVHHRVRREVRYQMLRDPDRSHARPTAAVRYAERFVEVEMADVGTHVAGAAEADLCIHVRATHVDLTAVLVHDAAHFFDRRLEHAVRRRIRHHQGT